MLTRKTKIISENYKLDNSFCKKWRTAVPLWPEWALEPPQWRPGARPGPSWERFGSVRERPGSARADPIAMEKWARAKNHKKHPKTFSKIKNISENDQLDDDCGNMRRTDMPLWPDWLWRAPPGQPRARPGASRERFGSVRKRRGSVQTSLIVEENWTHAKILVCLSNLS